MPHISMPAAALEIRRRPIMTLFASFAIAMIAGSYVFVMLLAAACVYIPYWLVFSSDSFSPQLFALFLFGIVIAVVILWSLVPRCDKFTPPGLLLDRATQARLFAELDSIAAALGETLPSEVYLIGAPNAFVADRGGVMGFGSRRVMRLGLPLLAVLTVSQFRAVLAHEFAHYYGGDTSLGPWVYRTKTSMIRIFENVGSVGELARIAILGVMYMVVAGLLKGYFEGFLRGINIVSRRQEYRADELACLVAGWQSLIEGLLAIHRAATAWPFYWNNEVSPALSEGSLVALGEGFTRFVSMPQIATAIDKSVEKRLQEERIEPFDTHPPLRDRIAAAEKIADSASPQDAQLANTLLENLAATELKFVEQCVEEMQTGTLQYVPWDEVGRRIRIPAWQKFVSEYSEPLRGVTAESVPTEVPKFREIGSRIRDPKGMLLSPPQRTARAGGLFAAALALAQIRNGWELVAQPGIFRIRRGGTEFNPFEAVNQLMAGKLTPEAWVARCSELGISKYPLLPTGGDSEVAASNVIEQPELFSSNRDSG